MIPAAFVYERAESVDDAVRLLGDHGSDGKLIAGGQSLLPLMKLRLARPELLIDIGRLAALRGVRELPDGRLSVGALTTYADLLARVPDPSDGEIRDALQGNYWRCTGYQSIVESIQAGGAAIRAAESG